MSKRRKKNQTPETDTQVSTELAPDATVVTAEVANDDAEAELTAEPVLDEEVLAMIAEDAASATTSEPEITADDVDEPTEDEVLAAIEATPSGKKSGAKRAPKTPAAPMREFTAVAQIDQATLDANLNGCNAKKVKEKAENLIASITHGKKLSRFTGIAVKQLATDGRVSSKSLIDAFQQAGLSLGTARAQAQQMTALLPLVGAAVRDPNATKDLIPQDNALVTELVGLAA